jgi:DNA-binding transcriptional LysR family regulator
MPSIDLNDLQAFAAVARHRGFRAAAIEQGVSASTLSQAVRDLEARLDLRLFNRTTRSVALTQAGSALLERTAPALADITAALDQLHARDGAPAGTVRINAPDPAIELVLANLIGPFLRAHPQVRLDVVGETSLIDIVAAGFDAGVRWGESLQQDMIAVPLGPPQRFTLVAAPSLIRDRGRPRRPEDLLNLPCIRLSFPSGRALNWELEKDGEVVRLDPTGPLISTNKTLQLRAAVEGLGYWASFEDHVAADIAAGRLERVLDDWFPSFPGPYLYYPSRRHMPAALRAFVDFVRAQRF